MTDTLARRDPRERLSKSFLQSVEGCGQRAWRSLRDPRPWSPPEKVSFGSAVDAGVELIATALRAGQEPDMDRAIAAGMARVIADPSPPDVDEVATALRRFRAWSVVDEAVWDYCLTQHTIRLELPGIGEVDAHPDLILTHGLVRDGSGAETIIDIKTGAKQRPANAAADSITELGWYALLREAETGVRPGVVGYWTYARTLKPNWSEVLAPVTDRMLRAAHARAATVARALEADAMLNDGVTEPVNSVFTNGPKYGCADCQFAGDCAWEQGGEDGDAA